jgi:tetratricopeptide (TPR) repeat protein
MQNPRPVVAWALAAFLATAALVLAPVPASARQAGYLTGSVKDIGGKPIKGATVRVRNPMASPAEFNVVTDSRGQWGVAGLQPGAWEVTVGAPGFETATVPVRVSVLRTNPEVSFVLVGTPVRGALEGVDTKELQRNLAAAEALMAAEKWDEAIAAYKAILASAPPLTMVNLALGRALRMKKDFAGAAAAYNDILTGDAGNQKALLELARCQQEGGDRAAAVATLEKLIGLDGTTDEAKDARALMARLKQ